MEINRIQITAMLKLAKLIAMADGTIDNKEIDAMNGMMQQFSIEEEDYSVLFSSAESMDSIISLAIISGLGKDEKKYAYSFLESMVAADGIIDPAETAVLGIIDRICTLTTDKL